MFQEEYESDQEEDIRMGYKNVRTPNPKALAPAEENMTLSMKQGEELMKIMKERGIDMKESEIGKMKTRQPEPPKKQSKAGFFDGGHSAPLEQLLAALKKAYSNHDQQQASCILSYILEKKDLSHQDRSKFGLMKCNLLYSQGAFEQCCNRATDLVDKPFNDLAYAQLSNYLAKCKAQLGRVWQGYMDLQRAKALMIPFEDQKKKQAQQDDRNDFGESEADSILRDINLTQLEFNVKVNKERATLNLIHPISNVFRNRRVLQVSTGDYHALFLVSSCQYDKQLKGRWATEVFAIGENRAGQVSGNIEHKQSFTEPILVKELSGKGIQNIFAFHESSLASDECGNIYEWGAKMTEKKSIQLTTSIREKVVKIERGATHYAALTKNNRLFVWGRIAYQEAPIFNEAKPFEFLKPKSQEVLTFSSGSSYLLIVTKKGELYGMGSNQYGQLASPGDKYFKEPTLINLNRIGKLKNVHCLVECSFFQNTENEIFFSGKYSHSKETLELPKQAEFPEDQPQIISISGHTGQYYATNQYGVLYEWQVDTSVKFKADKSKISQRLVESSKSGLYRIKTLPVQRLCSAKVITKPMKTFEPIIVEVHLRDEYGDYGLDLTQPVKYTVHLSRKVLKNEQIIEQSEKFLKMTASKYRQNIPYVDQIMGSQLIVAKPHDQQQDKLKQLLQFSIERAGTYYLYILMQSVIINSKPLELQVEVSEKQEELQRKMQQEKQRRRIQKELQRQKQEEQKKLLQEEQQAELQRKRETQKRAQQAYKQHMREQEELRRKEEQDRRRRAQLTVGGGYDLNKLKKKTSQPVNEILVSNGFDAQRLKRKPSEEQMDPNMTNQSFQSRKRMDYDEYRGEVPQLPDINLRPSSKRKLVLKKPSDGPELMKTTSNPSAKLGSTLVKRGDSRSKKP